MKKTLYILFTFSLLVGSGFLCSFQKNSSSFSDCAFCKEEVLASQSFYLGDKARALITYKPAVDGHVLIIPERHVERFEDLNPEELVEMGAIIKKVDLAIRNLYGTTGYLLLQKNGREAGQSVPHVHFHYLPRHEGDSHLLFALRFFASDYQRPLKTEEIEAITANLKAEMEVFRDRI